MLSPVSATGGGWDKFQILVPWRGVEINFGYSSPLQWPTVPLFFSSDSIQTAALCFYQPSPNPYTTFIQSTSCTCCRVAAAGTVTVTPIPLHRINGAALWDGLRAFSCLRLCCLWGQLFPASTRQLVGWEPPVLHRAMWLDFDTHKLQPSNYFGLLRVGFECTQR